MPSTSGREALEVEAGVIPIDLRIEEIAIRDLAKVQAKSITEPVKQQLVKYQEREQYDSQMTPFGKALIQSSDMEKTTSINIQLIEPEFTFRTGEMAMTMTRPTYWNRLGSSKSRTPEQELLCQEVINELMEESDSTQAISFTDGSCIGNPGPCGAGAIIYSETLKPAARLHRPVAQRGSILLAELVAILIALEFCITEGLSNSIDTMKIFSDSQVAVGILTLNWEVNSYIDVIRDITELIETLRAKGVRTIIAWTPGHANIAGNDEADLLAKRAANEAKELSPENNIITLQDVKRAAHLSTTSKWQRRWDISDKGRDLHEKIPTVDHKILYDFPTKHHYNVFTQLRTGYCGLNYYRYITGQSTDSNCSCGAIETVSHYLFECPLYEHHREHMLQELTRDAGVRNINIGTILTQIENEDIETTRRKLQIVAEFVDITSRFATTPATKDTSTSV